MTGKYTDEDLMGTLAFLFRQIKDLTVRSEALRYLCESKGVFDHDAYERVCADAVEKWNAMVADVAKQAATAAMLRTLTETPTKKTH